MTSLSKPLLTLLASSASVSMLTILWATSWTTSTIARPIEEIHILQNQPEASHSSNRESEAERLFQQGEADYQIGAYQDSRQHWTQAAAIYYEVGNYARLATTFNRIAASLQASEHYPMALEYYQQGFVTAQHVDDLQESVTALDGVGTIHTLQHQYEEAQDALELSLAISRSLGAQEMEAQTLLILGSVYSDRGHYDQAIELYQQSLDIVQSIGEVSESSVEPQALTLLGAAFGDKGDYDKAMSYYERGLSLWEPAQKKRVLYPLQRTLDQAIESEFDAVLERSLDRVFESADDYSGEFDADVANSLIKLLEQGLALYEAAGVEDTFSEVRTKSIKHNREGDEESQSLTTTVSKLSVIEPLFRLYWEMEEFDQALAFLSRDSAIRENETATNFLLLDMQEIEIAQLLSSFSSYELNAPITALVEKQLDGKDLETAAELSLLNILRRKGRTLEGLIRHSQQYLFQENLETRELVVELVEKNTLLSNLYFDSASDPASDDYVDREKALTARISEIREALQAASAGPELEDFLSESAVEELALNSTGAVGRLIPENAALIELVTYLPYRPFEAFDGLTDSRYAAYVLTKSGDIQTVDLGETETINQLVSRYRSALKNRAANINEISRQLDEAIMAPIRPLIGDKTHLLISPDDQLNVIPFDALVDEQNKYLIESFQISYLASGRDLITFEANSAVSNFRQQPPVIIANPDYSVAEGAVDAVASSSDDNRRAIATNSLRFSALPGTATEAAAIATLLPDATLLTEAEATESSLKQVDSPSILHIATHGFFLPDTVSAASKNSRGASFSLIDTDTDAADSLESDLLPVEAATEEALLRSGLALAGVNERRSGGDRIIEDGIFTALEAANLDLQGTQLVVLSACETGVGTISDEDGVYGLRRAFAIAGAESQLMSLWQVDDRGTSELMSLFYENLTQKRQGRSEALRNAQIEMLNTGTYQHPYYWSSFILSGNWQPLAIGDELEPSQ
ncbi:tetratricopeptide repeat domain protein [Synechococcus sp. PCC 7335]|uniref:CHAT domain-containing tetratricopeptide repeat protein n=1 Tax=Synechococcus sp. (strain ATCC 29403 / PCC 7335) TaxID=91464 RepID=UPI00017ECEB6|nr:CHAT domain-containing tetratricopeptide repeat protein [Synechococcus sp. PCC 7335]EDX87290.1 tetratricopeptide repeat domain protein [Synechococcus sp. PCC 7335]